MNIVFFVLPYGCHDKQQDHAICINCMLSTVDYIRNITVNVLSKYLQSLLKEIDIAFSILLIQVNVNFKLP